VSLCTSHGFCLLLVIVAVTVCLVAIFILSLSDDAFFLFSRVLFLHSDIILVTFFSHGMYGMRMLYTDT
jgi:hypothetical protein